ncbi:MAG: sugar kinase [Bryobacterales bacterium]|jgi:2-dehydro-3-deoxygluconokinase|nr:sugar kinase [Bryobacterales bacterium]
MKLHKPVVTFGEIMLRLTPPNLERVLQSPMFEASFGGGEANVAVGLAGFGYPARYVTVLPPNHPVADACIGSLRSFGVDTSFVARGLGRMGVYYLETGANQRPSKVTYDRAASSIALAKPGDIPWALAFEGAGWFHITGITPAISESAADMSIEALQTARDLGLQVSVDLNYRKNLWKWGKKAHEVMPQLVRLADVVVANEEDCQKALGIEADADVHAGKLEASTFRGLAERVLDAYPNLSSVAITLRESLSASHNGWSACLHDGSEFHLSRRYDITHIVDRVGGGDSFAAGLIYGLQELGSAAEALEFAVAASCLKHSIPGDFARLSAEDVHGLLKNGGSGRVQR